MTAQPEARALPHQLRHVSRADAHVLHGGHVAHVARVLDQLHRQHALAGEVRQDGGHVHAAAHLQRSPADAPASMQTTATGTLHGLRTAERGEARFRRQRSALAASTSKSSSCSPTEGTPSDRAQTGCRPAAGQWGLESERGAGAPWADCASSPPPATGS